jgi:hypothetical protein
VDDLGLPECTDPASFARAFDAMTRERADRAASRARQRALTLDDLGLPVDGSPDDLARAFRAVRSAIPLPRLRRRR